MGGVLASAPLDLVDLLFYLQGFKVVEFGLVRLEFGMELVLARLFLGRALDDVVLCPSTGVTYCLVPLKEHHSASLITSGKIVASVIELNG